MLPLGDRCLSIVPPGLLGGKRGFSVATLARRPRIVEDAGWLEFAFGDARRRRDEALRCNITATFFHPCDMTISHIIIRRIFCQKFIKKLLVFILIFDKYQTIYVSITRKISEKYTVK